MEIKILEARGAQGIDSVTGQPTVVGTQLMSGTFITERARTHLTSVMAAIEMQLQCLTDYFEVDALNATQRILRVYHEPIELTPWSGHTTLRF